MRADSRTTIEPAGENPAVGSAQSDDVPASAAIRRGAPDSQTTKITAGPGHLEVVAINGQVVIYIPPLDHHVAFSPSEALEFAGVVLGQAKPLTMAPLPPMRDEIEALEDLLRLGRASLDEQDDSGDAQDDSGDASREFRDALAEWSDDTLWRLLMRVTL